MFDNRSKVPIFCYTISLIIAATISIVYVNSIIYTVSLNSVAFSQPPNTQKTLILRIKSIIKNVPVLHSMKEEDDDRNTETLDCSVPPFNLSVKERLVWFQRNLQEFRIFQSSNFTRKFHSRVVKFFRRDCETQIFMTWISPAGYFGKREFLALESLFKANPRGCLAILSRTMDSKEGFRILKPLLDYGFKILTVAPDLSFLFKNTPAEIWFDEIRSGKKDPGQIPLAQNLSNLMRLAILYKYGGVYLDTDFIVLKSFKGLRNSIGAQSIEPISGNWTRLNNAILIFDKNHPILAKFMNEFASTFDGNRWGFNGPYLVSRVVENLGRTSGYNFTILPQSAFYPVDWTKIRGLFHKSDNKIGSKWIKGKILQLEGGSYTIHLWNKQSRRFSIEDGSVLGLLILDHCIICRGIYNS